MNWLEKIFGKQKQPRKHQPVPEQVFRAAKLPPRRSEESQPVTNSTDQTSVSVGMTGQPVSNIGILGTVKLYKRVAGQLHYHEAWCHQGVITEHCGVIGDRGQDREHRVPRGVKEGEEIQRILQPVTKSGFTPIDTDDHAVLLVEYAVDGFGTEEDLAKRHALEERLGETLGWTGLGDCDGGSVGSGTMEVCCFVVDFDVAKRVIEADLKGTGYGDYTRIYREDADS
jgi:hypothetical protein